MNDFKNPSSLSAEERAVLKKILLLLNETPWQQLTIPTLIAQLELDSEKIPSSLKSKEGLLKGLIRLIDEETLDLFGEGPKEVSLHDRLFDLVMCRFDAMAPYKKGLKSIWDELPTHPLFFLPALIQGFFSLNHLLEKIGFDQNPFCDKLYLGSFAVFYLSAIRVWHKDETPDQSQTMAYVDQGLKKLNALLTFAL